MVKTKLLSLEFLWFQRENCTYINNIWLCGTSYFFGLDKVAHGKVRLSTTDARFMKSVKIYLTEMWVLNSFMGCTKFHRIVTTYLRCNFTAGFFRRSSFHYPRRDVATDSKRRETFIFVFNVFRTPHNNNIILQKWQISIHNTETNLKIR